jgi:hypothetical protein
MHRGGAGSTRASCSGLRALRRREQRRFERPEVVAVIADGAAVAERPWLADSAAVQNQRVGGSRPLGSRHRRTQLLLDDLGILRARDAESVGDPQHVAIDRKSRHAQRVPEHHVGGLPADAGQLRKGVHGRRDLAAMLLHECP